jgi:hypothetical protein
MQPDPLTGCHDIQHNDTQHSDRIIDLIWTQSINDAQQKDTQLENLMLLC